MPGISPFSRWVGMAVLATLLTGCGINQKVGGWSDWLQRDRPAADTPQQVSQDAMEPMAAPPAPAPTPIEMITPSAVSVPDAADLSPAELSDALDASPLPPMDPIVFEDEVPLPPLKAPTSLETYEVLVPEGDFVFLPREITIFAGDTVLWKNNSGVVHLFATIPGSDPSGKMEVEPVDLNVGESVSHTFASAGTFPYFCFIHNKMTGKVVVHER